MSIWLFTKDIMTSEFFDITGLCGITGPLFNSLLVLGKQHRKHQMSTLLALCEGNQDLLVLLLRKGQ